VIEDDLAWARTCPEPISIPVAPGAQLVCQTDYTIPGVRWLTGTIDRQCCGGNRGVSQPFVSRLQSNAPIAVHCQAAFYPAKPARKSCTPQSVFQPTSVSSRSASQSTVTRVRHLF